MRSPGADGWRRRRAAVIDYTTRFRRLTGGHTNRTSKFSVQYTVISLLHLQIQRILAPLIEDVVMPGSTGHELDARQDDKDAGRTYIIK